MTKLGQRSEAFPKVSDFRKVYHPKMVNRPNFVMHSKNIRIFVSIHRDVLLCVSIFFKFVELNCLSGHSFF